MNLSRVSMTAKRSVYLKALISLHFDVLMKGGRRFDFWFQWYKSLSGNVT